MSSERSVSTPHCHLALVLAAAWDRAMSVAIADGVKQVLFRYVDNIFYKYGDNKYKYQMPTLLSTADYTTISLLGGVLKLCLAILLPELNLLRP